MILEYAKLRVFELRSGHEMKVGNMKNKLNPNLTLNTPLRHPTPDPGTNRYGRVCVSPNCQPISPCDYDNDEGDNRSDDEGRLRAVPLSPFS